MNKKYALKGAFFIQNWKILKTGNS